MNLSKRQFLSLSAATAIAATLGIPVASVYAASELSAKRIEEFAAGKKPQTGKISLTTPEIAENGNTVPITFDVESPMTKDNYVAAVMLLADGNPLPGVATFKFSPLSGEATATTRIRLAKTQDVIAVAKMSDGSVYMDTKTVKVTIGGCGG